MRTFLKCASAEHAEVVDQLVAEMLRDTCGTHCTGWSGVYTDGVSFGVLWAAPVSSLFGVPEIDPSLVLVEDAERTWEQYDPNASDFVRLVLCESAEQAVDIATGLETKVYVDYTGSGERYAVSVSEEQETMFPGKVFDGELLVREDGQFVSGNWEELVLE